jgi:hypothetical protein
MFAFSAALLAVPALGGPVILAQRDTVPATPSENERAAALLRQNNITSTGATVPHPGTSQGAGTTPLDQDIERMNDKIESRICKGC